MTIHSSDVVLGDRYRDPLTGFEGVATAVTFYLYGCERVSLEYVKDGKVEFEAFDTPRLVHVAGDLPPGVPQPGGLPGGPGGREASKASVVRR